MTRFRLFAFAICAFATTAVAQDTKPAKMDLAQMLPGSYKITGGMKGGEKISEDSMKDPLTVTKDKITLKSNDMTFVFGYKLDADAKPAKIMLEIEEPEALKGSKATGLLKMEDGKLTLVYHPEGKQTPKEFKSTEENGMFLFEMEKAKGKGKGKGKKKDKDGN